MRFEFKPYYRDISDNEIIDDIKKVAKQLNKNTITRDEYEKYGKYHPATVSRKFRSWFIALEKSGLQKSRSLFNIPKEELFKNLANVWTSLGRQPHHKDMKQPLSFYGGNTYIRRFGTWMKALEAFVKSIDQDSSTAKSKNETKIHLEQEALKAKIIERQTKRDINLRLRFQVFLRDGFRCQSCGLGPVNHPGVELHVDHIKPWSKGGETITDNLRTLCSKCNYGKGNLEETNEW